MKNKDLIKKAFLIRRFEEKLLSLFSEGQLHGTVHTCVGQEWSGVAAANALEAGDTIFSNHRCHGHFLAWTWDVFGLFAEILGKSSGVCCGIGGSQHLHTQGFYSDGIQGGMVPIASGRAFAEKISGTNNICLVFIGDGTFGQGVLYESLNIASKHEVPLLIVVENNKYAQSTHQNETLAGSIKDRAAAFDIEYGKTSTWQTESLFDDFVRASCYVREKSKPYMLEVVTYRLKGHSKGDDYREREEVRHYEEIDPLNLFAKENPQEFIEIQLEVDGFIERELEKAMASGILQAEALIQDGSDEDFTWTHEHFEKERIVNLINQAFKENMGRNSQIIMIGEDLKSPYGGAFKVTRDLSVLAPERIINMPISESALIGVGTGLALGGYIPVVEIMFGDFLTLGFDQLINHACKFQFMYNNKVKVPLVVRTPMGGKRGYGPTHSQSLEKHFLGIPNLEVLALNCRVSPKKVYDELLETVTAPILVIENKVLYTRFLHSEPIEGFEIFFSTEKYPTILISPVNKKADVTIFCYGGTLEDVEKAVEVVFDEDEIICEVICPTRIYPSNISPVLESVKETNRLLIVEEGASFASLGSEVLAQLMERGAKIDSVKRINWNNYIPSCYELEKSLLVCPETIVEALRKF